MLTGESDWKRVDGVFEINAQVFFGPLSMGTHVSFIFRTHILGVQNLHFSRFWGPKVDGIRHVFFLSFFEPTSRDGSLHPGISPCAESESTVTTQI